MDYYFLLCRSLTYGQRSVSILERAGISAYLSRLPKAVAVRGCGYGVKVASRNLNRSLAILESYNLSPKEVYAISPEGAFLEYSKP